MHDTCIFRILKCRFWKGSAVAFHQRMGPIEIFILWGRSRIETRLWLVVFDGMQMGVGMKSKMVSGSFIGFVCLIQAFVILCDWLLILSHQDSNNNEEEVGFLDYLPSTSLQEKLLLFVQEHIFVEEKEESKGQTSSALKKHSTIFAALCRLCCKGASHCWPPYKVARWI